MRFKGNREKSGPNNQEYSVGSCKIWHFGAHEGEFIFHFLSSVFVEDDVTYSSESSRSPLSRCFYLERRMVGTIIILIKASVKGLTDAK